MALNRNLPPRYVAAPRVHLGPHAEIDVTAYEANTADTAAAKTGGANAGVATALWAPPLPTLDVAVDLPEQDEYEVRVYDTQRHRRLVAAVEIIRPANKDRPELRRAFVAKCAALLQQRVSADRKLLDSQALAEQPVVSPDYPDSGAAPVRSSGAFSTAGKTLQVAW
jgi:hypothetical protein